MEMISYLIVAVASLIVGFHGLMYLDRRLRTIKPEAKLRLLSDQSVRTELSGFLRKQMVQGDADIRAGIVFPPVHPDRLEPLARVLGRANDLIGLMANREADALYIRHNGSWHLTGIDLLDLADAARVISRVAEDRRKSRSIYKGMTDEEMRHLTRVGLSSWLKDDGSFPESNEVAQGLWDDRPEFLMAMNVLDMTFKVKGVRND